MAVKPFHLRLKKVSSKQQRLIDALMSFLPKTGLRSRFRLGIDEALAKHVGDGVSYQLESVSEMTYQSFSNKLPAKPLLAVLSCAPVDARAYLQIDNVIAQVFISCLLGGDAEEEQVPRALTDTEQGIMQYLLLQLLSHVYRMCGRSTRVHFRFDSFVTDPGEAAGLTRADEVVSVLVVRVDLGEHTGYVKLVFPNPLVESSFLDVQAPGELRVEEFAYDLEQLKRFESFRVRLWAEAGRTTLKPGELSQLERDDVVLFDETDIALGENGAPKGKAILRVGRGERGGFWADISAEAKAVHARLAQHFKGESI
jgi:flagellar motor switch protein FliM